MEKIQAANESCSQNLGRVTTDAVHRRFLSGGKHSNNKKVGERDKSEEDFYYCKQCNQKISAFFGKEELKAHFETVRHNSFINCIYCGKPVYDYRFKKKVEVFHICNYD